MKRFLEITRVARTSEIMDKIVGSSFFTKKKKREAVKQMISRYIGEV